MHMHQEKSFVSSTISQETQDTPHLAHFVDKEVDFLSDYTSTRMQKLSAKNQTDHQNTHGKSYLISFIHGGKRAEKP